MATPPKFEPRDPVEWLDPDNLANDFDAWVVERHRNGTYHVVWANNFGGHGGAHEDDLHPRDDAGPVPAFVDDLIAKETAEARRMRRDRRS